MKMTKSGNIEVKTIPFTEESFKMFKKAMRNSCTPTALEVFDFDYAFKLTKKAKVSPYAFMLSLIYIERVRQQSPDYFRKVSPCDLFLVSLMAASKVLIDEGEDEEIKNDRWATIAQLKLRYINQLEREFLSAIDWNLFVHQKIFYETMVNIIVTIIRNECRKRCWNGLTYNEIMVLLEYDEKFKQVCLLVYQYMVKVMLVFSLTYSAIILSVLSTEQSLPN
ncbi:protein CNPPD1 [Tetranychus urticae]|uniref:Protein CNPPD1 n=1 Tax=Tetranychus urticae TaxID=32264 RepID=T1L455_TETUR|nr:protein CNPPD1 [Tetranychus urticae]